MKTETEVIIKLLQLTPSQNLTNDNEGFLIKVFFSCTRADTKTFKIDSNVIKLNQTLKIKNIIGNNLQLWLCTTYGKIIAISEVHLQQIVGQEKVIDFKLVKTHFATLSIYVETIKREIQKPIYIEPDQELLKKVSDPIEEQRKEQEEKKKAKEIAEQIQAQKIQKKPIVTLTQYSKKDQPFI